MTTGGSAMANPLAPRERGEGGARCAKRNGRVRGPSDQTADPICNRLPITVFRKLMLAVKVKSGK